MNDIYITENIEKI